MTIGDVVAIVLAFVRMSGPIGAVLWLVGALSAILAVIHLLARLATRFPGRKSFDVGGGFDHFYSRILPALRSGAVTLIYAGYAAIWLAAWPANGYFTWLHQPYNSLVVGVIATAITAGLIGQGTVELLKSSWFAMRWLRLEARGILWHIADSGEPYRTLWLRANGEFLYDTTIRDHRLQQELTAIRARRQRLVKEVAVAALAFLVWLKAPELIAAFYPLLPAELVGFLQRWAVLPILAWLVFLFAVIPHTADAITALLDELVYRAGAQFIPGAKVLDPRPTRLGREHVENQNAHGDADFVPADEAVRRMAGRPEL